MWVDPAARGLGAGRALLVPCIAWAKHQGARQLRLSVTTGESPAARLYAAQGFQPVGDADALRPGSSRMAQAMALDLNVGT